MNTMENKVSGKLAQHLECVSKCGGIFFQKKNS
jgi:hypothetical protein